MQGFLKAAGLKSLDEAKIQRDPKGDFYIALLEKEGRPAIDVIAEIIPLIIRTFPWPKQMRWGERSARNGALTWVRPLHSIIATFGPETEEPDVVKFDIAGIEVRRRQCAINGLAHHVGEIQALARPHAREIGLVSAEQIDRHGRASSECRFSAC